MPLEALLLDATGTLLSVREPVGETYARIAAAHGAKVSAQRLGVAFARAMAEAPPPVFPAASADEIDRRERAWWYERVRTTFRGADALTPLRDFDTCFGDLFAHFGDAQAWQLRPGTREALAACRDRGLRLAIVSNFDRRLHGLLEGLGIASEFECVVLPSDCGAAKPDAAIFEHALRALGVAAQDAVFVGDDAVRDIAGARAQGLHAIDVAALATLAELPDALAQLERAGSASLGHRGDA